MQSLQSEHAAETMSDQVYAIAFEAGNKPLQFIYIGIELCSNSAVGKLPAHKAGREWRFDAQELDEYLKAGKLSLPKEMK